MDTKFQKRTEGKTRRHSIRNKISGEFGMKKKTVNVVRKETNMMRSLHKKWRAFELILMERWS
jgi:hypothetical protein